MIPLEEAQAILLEGAGLLGTEAVPLAESVGRVLAEDVAADLDMPPFDKSAMDGYACRRADLGLALTVNETIKAGFAPTRPVEPGTCSKIMTGAMVPEGADCVIMVEHTAPAGENAIRFTGEKTRDNICPRGEDMCVGEVVLARGRRIAPQHVALLASVGCVTPVVARRPRVGVIATGDELVLPEAVPAPSQIRSSNSIQLCAQVNAAGGRATDYGIAADTEASLHEHMKRAFGENDVVLLSGGVSMGDFDLVPRVMVANGLEILFDAIAMKPGKPTTFGRAAGLWCIGLPGNPVSTFVQFELLVRPLLRALTGDTSPRPCCRARLGAALRRRGLDRHLWYPVQNTGDGGVMPCEFHGSAHVGSLTDADGLIAVPMGVAELAEGEEVEVHPIG